MVSIKEKRKELTMEKLEKYKTWAKANSLSDNTIINYLLRLNKIMKDFPLSDWTTENMEKYIISLKERYKANTVNCYLDAIRSFSNFLELDIKIPKNSKQVIKIPKVINEEYLDKEIIPIIRQKALYPVKFTAIIYFMFYTGIRVGEIQYLKREHIDLENKTAKIYGEKTKAERLVVFPEQVKIALKNYFLTEIEEKNAFNITSRSLKMWFYRNKKYWKPNINFSAHLLRHSFATHAQKKMKNIRQVQILLGHKNINTTTKYEHGDFENIKQSYEENIG